jgi:hypothetical protein
MKRGIIHGWVTGTYQNDKGYFARFIPDGQAAVPIDVPISSDQFYKIKFDMPHKIIVSLITQ